MVAGGAGGGCYAEGAVGIVGAGSARAKGAGSVGSAPSACACKVVQAGSFGTSRSGQVATGRHRACQLGTVGTAGTFGTGDRGTKQRWF